MSNEIKEAIEEYQWIKGEHQGIIEVYKDTKGKFLVFESGNKCNKELIGEYIHKIDMFNPALEFDNPLTKQSKPKPGEVAAKAVEVIMEKPAIVQSPIVSLLEKAKTKKTKLNTRIEMNLPTKEFLDVLQQSWDEDILSIQAEYIVSQIEDPKQFLTDKIKMSLSDWFKSGSKGESKVVRL